MQHQQGPSSPKGALENVIQPSLKVGAFTGGLGLFFGSFMGIIRSANPVIFTVASGLQWCAVGTIYWASRSTVLETRVLRTEDQPLASGIAAAIAGGSAGAIARGRRNILPGAVVFSVIGYTGQHIYDIVQSQGVLSNSSTRISLNHLANSKWSPFKALSDHEYEEMLQERLIRVESEIAILDEDIKSLQEALGDKR